MPQERTYQSRETSTREEAKELGSLVVKHESGQTTAEHTAEVKEEIDSLLDEIDAVLETNAEEFVKGYVQKGGE